MGGDGFERCRLAKESTTVTKSSRSPMATRISKKRIGHLRGYPHGCLLPTPTSVLFWHGGSAIYFVVRGIYSTGNRAILCGSRYLQLRQSRNTLSFEVLGRDTYRREKTGINCDVVVELVSLRPLRVRASRKPLRRSRWNGRRPKFLCAEFLRVREIANVIAFRVVTDRTYFAL